MDVNMLEKPLGEVSTGEKKQIQLAFAMARRPKLLLLDEPGANLDPVFRVSLMDKLQSQIAREELSVILSTHILEDIEDVADYVGVMEEGRMSFFGDRESFPGQMGGSVLWM
ncbi:MAG: ATP-binding cassette domain-containing protein [Roseburia sp.]|nr:ATP-binding cassette domain-containing protein [Roseburia sp.]